MHMCDELADFERQAICMPNRIRRRANGPVRHTCQPGSAVVETIYSCSSTICRRWSLWEGRQGAGRQVDRAVNKGRLSSGTDVQNFGEAVRGGKSW
jgi:hypothetical protein